MKKFIALTIAALSIFSLSAEDLYVYSKDAVTANSGARILPSVGVNLTTGQAVLGLHGRTDEEKSACGWYRVVGPDVEIATNQYFTCTGYVFRAGTAVKIGVVKDKPRTKTITKYSKLAIYQAVCALDKWADLEMVMKETNINGVNVYNAWTFAQYFTDENPLFIQVVSNIGTTLGLTQEQITEMLKSCEDGKEVITIDENGEPTARRVPRGLR